jgi:hypothetical protein
LTVRIYVPDKDPIRWDIQRILRDVAAKREGQDVIVNLRIIVISHQGGSVTAYLIPWDQLRISTSGTGKARAELSRYAVAPPVDLDAAEIAREMALTDTGSPTDAS